MDVIFMALNALLVVDGLKKLRDICRIYQCHFTISIECLSLEGQIGFVELGFSNKLNHLKEIKIAAY